MQRMGIGDEHLPFDWIRTSSEGVQHFVDEDFAEYFSVAVTCDIPNTNMKLYRSKRHSFWHDDISQQATRDKLQRRVDRFLALRVDTRDLLFVRSVATTDEVCEIERLYAILVKQFGGVQRRVLLAVVADGQDVFRGPIRHATLPGVICITQPQSHAQHGPGHCEAIACAASLALTAPDGCDPSVGFGLVIDSLHDQWSSIRNGGDLQSRVSLFDAPLNSGFGNLKCFEPQNSQHVDLSASTHCQVRVLRDGEP